jgi:hypothetical protein
MPQDLRLFDIRMADGSRHFAEVPWRPGLILKQRVLELPGATVTAFLDAPIETWLDFDYRGHQFSAHNPVSDFWLFVRDPSCPEELLREVKNFLEVPG